jgi:hypothetical protein
VTRRALARGAADGRAALYRGHGPGGMMARASV